MAKYLSNSEEQTKQIASNLAKTTKDHIFALTGELGAGKTIFVQGFAKGLGIKEKIISPTFVLIRQHKIPDTTKILYHIDLYRLADVADFKNLGVEEIWSDPNNIVLVEWVEKIKKNLPENTTWISIKILKENVRRISVKTGVNSPF